MLSRIDEILERCSAGIGGTVLINGKYEDGIEVEKAKQQLLELINEARIDEIEKCKVIVMDYESWYPREFDERITLLNEYHSNIRKLFE